MVVFTGGSQLARRVRCTVLWCRAPSRATSLGEAPTEDRRAWPCAQSSSSYRPSFGITRCFYGLDASARVSRGGLWPGLKVRWVTLSSGWTNARWRAPAQAPLGSRAGHISLWPGFSGIAPNPGFLWNSGPSRAILSRAVARAPPANLTAPRMRGQLSPQDRTTTGAFRDSSTPAETVGQVASKTN